MADESLSPSLFGCVLDATAMASPNPITGALPQWLPQRPLTSILAVMTLHFFVSALVMASLEGVSLS